MRIRVLGRLVLPLLLAGPPAAAQDVELLGDVHGTRPPEGYLRRRAADPGAFQFARGRALRLRVSGGALRIGGAEELGAEALRDAPAAVLGPREGPVEGTFHIPVVLGLFADSPPDLEPFASTQIEDAYFGDGAGTITAYYDEVSRGRARVVGHVQAWTRSLKSQLEATGGESGLVAGTVGPFIVDLLRQIAGVDWGLYDNDGPDGVPNSGDDDGYVDVLAVIHPTLGAECGGAGQEDRIWSHRWSLASAAGATFVTDSPRTGGGVIRIDDYVIQPVYACSGTALNEIGVFTHELGHAFGLPDLYDTYPDDGKHSGAGNWDLMATGSWGCDSHSPHRPCHLSAWSKAVLGWADVQTLPAGAGLSAATLPPVETTGKVFLVDAQDGSGEYFLLENRQRLGFDASLFGEGLLVWQINRPIVEARWPVNAINALQQLGGWLRQADGLNELGLPGGGRGDADDPFPFLDAGVLHGDFHAGSVPSARSLAGSATGLTLLGARRVGDDVTFEIGTRLTRVTVRSEGDGGGGGLFTVNGAAVSESPSTSLSAPFDLFRVEAAAGEAIGEGVRRPFVGWSDAPEEDRVRELVTPLDDVTLTARYGGREVELAMELTGGVNGVTPATFATVPAVQDLWFPEGTSATVEAIPRTGFRFVEWTGALGGSPNPATVLMDAPVQAGAAFELTFAMPASRVSITAAVSEPVILVPQNGTAPYSWRVVEGRLPEGLFLNGFGSMIGAAMEVGTFTATLEVRDAIGLTARGELVLDVVEPELSAALIASPFLLSGPSMTEPQRRFLDGQGNGNGVYDLGDFRAWALAHPGLPMSAPLRALVGTPRTVTIGTTPVGEGVGR
ncbi:MAG TPA: M6 family metalloprotease domain-containing protein [Longimicrobiales bacterium]|nr:M6 family metalloprotease domain-containing protein [Longimicrobiales bacterium]